MYDRPCQTTLLNAVFILIWMNCSGRVFATILNLTFYLDLCGYFLIYVFEIHFVSFI